MLQHETCSLKVIFLRFRFFDLYSNSVMCYENQVTITFTWLNQIRRRFPKLVLLILLKVVLQIKNNQILVKIFYLFKKI